jgi:2-polyprenyl-3-methyl-5-hydroxy-6-metoxy-1,4-benzoquinol methylase
MKKRFNEYEVKSGLDETPEFFFPEYDLEIDKYIEKEDIQGIHHLGRYHWAKQVLGSFSPANILDIACGAGYGSFILASHLNQVKVVGVDYDNRGIEIAKQTYRRKNLSYMLGNIVTWEYEHGESIELLGSYDAIVSFDTIEHLLHREIALIRIAQNLSANGVLLFSTPCGHNTTQINPGWEHHKIEYGFLDLQNLLKRYFGTVMIPEEGDFPNMEYWENIINKGKNRYLNLSNPIVCLNPIKY